MQNTKRKEEGQVGSLLEAYNRKEKQNLKKGVSPKN